MKAGTAQKISNAILSCAAGFASFLFSLTALLYLTEFDEKILAALGRRRLLPADQLHRLRTAEQRKRPRACRAWRPAARGRGRRPRLAGAAGRCAERCPSSRPRSTRLFAEVRASIENAHALGMYDPVTSLPNRLHFRSEADKLLGEASSGTSSAMLFVDLDRFKIGQRQPRPCARRPAADHGRQPPARRRQRRVHRQRAHAGRCSRASPATSSPCSSPRSTSVDEIERVARRVVLAISEPFELCSHSVDIGASIGVAISPDHGTSIESLMRAADIAMYRAKSIGGGQHCLFNDELAAEHQEQGRDREGADRGGPARRVRARLPAADEPRHRRGRRRRGAAALEPSARRPAHAGHLHPDRRADRRHRRDRRLGDGRSRRRSLGSWHRDGFAGRLAFNVSPRQVDRADFFARLRQAFADAERAAVADRARVHRERGDGSQRGGARRDRGASRRRRDASRSTISAPAIRTSRGCARCRSTGSSSTRR